MEYILYCDESSSNGGLFSDFFGGCLLPQSKLTEIETALNQKKRDLHLLNEVKWTRVTAPYLDKYCALIHLFFEYVRSNDIHIRIMFRKSSDQYERGIVPVKDERYFKLYYQFLKHAFGFSTDKSVTGEYYVHFLMDELPDHTDQATIFKEFLCALPSAPNMHNTGLHVRMRDIGEVNSADHVILQCVDVVLGAMFFRLNQLHKVKDAKTGKRGKRTIAKEKLYKYISDEIRSIHPNFNIGVSTGFRNLDNPHWTSPYEHWRFVPKDLF